MITEVHQIQFIDESRRQRGQQTQRDVYTPGREPTLQGGVCPQAKLADTVAELDRVKSCRKPGEEKRSPALVGSSV